MKQKIIYYLIFLIIFFGFIYFSKNQQEADKINCINKGGVYFYDYEKDVGKCNKLF